MATNGWAARVQAGRYQTDIVYVGVDAQADARKWIERQLELALEERETVVLVHLWPVDEGGKRCGDRIDVLEGLRAVRYV